jgi:Arc/MetJ-type ribon-helix-helix transcriptional regulator
MARNITIRMDDELIEDVEAAVQVISLVEMRGVSLSEVIRDAVRAYIDELRQNPDFLGEVTESRKKADKTISSFFTQTEP